MPRIFILDDEPEMIRIARDLLMEESHEVETFSDADRALARMREATPDLLLLDVRMPKISGFDVLRLMKEDPQLRSIPVIMVSVKKDETNVVMGLELGAEDYVRKPYQAGELMARIRVALRRPKTPLHEERFRSGPLEIDLGRYTARLNGQDLKLRPKEFQLLAFFLKWQGRVLTRETISRGVWKIEHLPTSRRIDFYVDQLRKKLGPCGRWIQSLKGVGYRFEAGDD